MQNFNKVWGRLYQGSRPDISNPLANFDLLVLSAKEYQPRMPRFKGKIIRVPLIDTPWPTNKEIKAAHRVAANVASALRKGKKVLVTCRAGLNRSGLIVGLALRIISPTVHPYKIVDRIRERRGSDALTNPTFERIVEIGPTDYM